jgi:alkanesulfonate monooxygenase
MRQLAQAIDYSGFDGALLATGSGMDDAWTVAASLAPLTKKMKFIIAQHAGVTSRASH